MSKVTGEHTPAARKILSVGSQALLPAVSQPGFVLDSRLPQAAFQSTPTHPRELAYAHTEAPGLLKVVWWSRQVKWMTFMVSIPESSGQGGDMLILVGGQAHDPGWWPRRRYVWIYLSLSFFLYWC